MSFSDKWSKSTDAQKYAIREQSGLRAKINQCNKMFWRENGEWVAKIENELHRRDTWGAIVSLCLFHKYGIEVRIIKESPLTYEKLGGTKPILNDERFGSSINNETMSHVKNLDETDWMIIFQSLSKLAYHKDPAQQVPAAAVVLKKLNLNIRGE